MFPIGPTLFILGAVVAACVIDTVGFTWLWGVFAVTLGLTTAVAIYRSIPRKER